MKTFWIVVRDNTPLTLQGTLQYNTFATAQQDALELASAIGAKVFVMQVVGVVEVRDVCWIDADGAV